MYTIRFTFGPACKQLLVLTINLRINDVEELSTQI